MHCTSVPRRSAQVLAALLLVSVSWLATAQEKCPSRPIEFIVPWRPTRRRS